MQPNEERFLSYLINDDCTLKFKDDYKKIYVAVHLFTHSEPSFTSAFLKRFIEVLKVNNLQWTDVIEVAVKADIVTDDDIAFVFDTCVYGWRIEARLLEPFYEKIVRSGYKFRERDYIELLRDPIRSSDNILRTVFTSTKMTLDELIKFSDLNQGCFWFNVFMELDPNKLITVSTEIGNCIYTNLYGFNNKTTVMKWFLDRKFVPDQQTIELVCSAVDIESLIMLLNEFKLDITKDRFVRILKEICFVNQDRFTESVPKLIDLLFNNGVKIALADIIILTGAGFYVNNVERFIENDTDKQLLIKLCYRCDMYKYPELLGISKQTAELYECCLAKHTALNDVKRLIKNGCKPDLHSLKLACSRKHQKKVVNYLLDFVEPDSECFNILCKTFDNSGVILRMSRSVKN